jgi:hypothetical protein
MSKGHFHMPTQTVANYLSNMIDNGEATNLQVGEHMTIFQFLGRHKLKIFKIYLSIYTYVRGFRNFWVGLCPLGLYSGFATDD